jgi:hypothetical protein
LAEISSDDQPRPGQPESSSRPPAEPAADPIRRLQRSSTLALALSPVGIILIAATRLLIVSDYKVSTATAIVSSDGYVNTLLGTLLPVVPLLIPYLALVLLFTRRFIVGLLALAVATLVSPSTYPNTSALHMLKADVHKVWEWSQSNAYIFVLASLALGLLLFSAALGISALARTLGVLLAVALVPIALQLYPLPVGPTYYATLLKQPWLPEERITLHARPTVLGYVLADSNVSMEVLVQTDRSVVFYPNALITSEQICEASPRGAGRPLLPLTPPEHPAPPCEPPSPPPRPLLDRGAENPPTVQPKTVVHKVRQSCRGKRRPAHRRR